MEKSIIEKWAELINAAKKYWIDSEPTGLDDMTFDRLEAAAIQEDKFSVRNYVFDTYLKGKKTLNRCIEKIQKFKVNGVTMLNAIEKSQKDLGIDLYCTLKYDGSSIALYPDPKSGYVKRIVTVGNLNIDNYGIDQTWKLISFVPRFPKGIVAVQCEALVDTTLCSEPDRARQKANGLINSKYADSEVNKLLTLRAYRYYTDDSEDGLAIRNMNYRDVINSFDTVTSIDGRVLFAPAQIWTVDELKLLKEYTETTKTITETGTFLNDGWVLYNQYGHCQMALKYSGAGSNSESLKTKVLGIQWNDQSSKGKDSWSANVLIEPVEVRGTTIKKPSAGSIGKLIKNNITKGATVGIILANSTIPMVGDVYEGGDGNYEYPTCSCGYKLSEKDVYGALLKCGNPLCTVRLDRMNNYLSGRKPEDINLDELLVIDRFKWENTKVSMSEVFNKVKESYEKYLEYLSSFLSTELQKKNLDLVAPTSYRALLEYVNK